MRKKKALILGSTGLVGGHLLRLLLDGDQYSSVTALVRRRPPVTHKKLDARIIDFNTMEKNRDLFAVDDVFCCLGTTMRQAGSKESFRLVDYQYPLAAARLAAAKKASRYLIITATMADPDSFVFYSRVKGELEEALKKIPFHALHIFRPSLLVGERSDKRLAEGLTIRLSGLFPFIYSGPFRRYRPIRAEVVAAVMAEAARGADTGVRVHESAAMQDFYDTDLAGKAGGRG